MDYEVSVTEQPRRPVAAVAATTSWDRFPGQWPGMLHEVWACLRRARVKGGGNVMRYRDVGDGRVAVEFGVEVEGTFPLAGAVVMSALPAGRTAETAHREPCEELDAAHRAVRRWCTSAGHQITGERWEVYGDWHEDPAQLQTTVSYSLRQARPGDA